MMFSAAKKWWTICEVQTVPTKQVSPKYVASSVEAKFSMVGHQATRSEAGAGALYQAGGCMQENGAIQPDLGVFW